MEGWGWMEGRCSCKSEWCAGIPHCASQITDTRFTCIGDLEEGELVGRLASVVSAELDPFPLIKLPRATLSF